MNKMDKVAARLRADISSGAYPPGALLPSVRDLALLHRINPHTIVRALNHLVDEGLVVAEARRGYFAASGCMARARKLRQSEARERLDHALDEVLAAGGDRSEIMDQVRARIAHAERKSA